MVTNRHPINNSHDIIQSYFLLGVLLSLNVIKNVLKSINRYRSFYETIAKSI